MFYVIRITLFLFLFVSSLMVQAQHEEPVDIDEWQTLKVEAAKDPFAKGKDFTINFARYAIEEWHYPLPEGHLISPFGGERHHAGTDIKSFPGDTIRAAFAGEVILSGLHFGYGQCVVLRHANGLETLYSHNSANLVSVGRWVQAGEALALEGSTGRATTHHLHFETRVQGKAFDSEIIFDHQNHLLRYGIFVFTKQANGAIKISAITPD